MAQLKSTVVQGSLRVTDSTFTNSLTASDLITARALEITDTNAVLHIKFNRSNYNYLSIPSEGELDISAGVAATAGSMRIGVTASGNNMTSGYIWPGVTNVADLGSSSLKWKNVYATTFNGDLTGDVTGNADTATKWADATTVYVALGTASKTKTIQGNESSAVALGIDGKLGETHGGTGQNAYTIGDILYSDAANSLGKLGGNTTTTRKFLRSVATTSGTAVAPAWDTVTKADVGLSNVENTKLSTWTGTTNVSTLKGLTLSGTAAASYIAAFAGTTDASSSSTAAVTIAGGLAVAKNAYIGNNLYVGTPSATDTFPSYGIHVWDARTADISPSALDYGVNFYFINKNQPHTGWSSGMYVRGWHGNNYAAWCLVGPATDADQSTAPLYVRTSKNASTWGSYRKIYDTSNKPSKSDVGLGNVENVKLSTWTGTDTIATVGTITSGTWNGTTIAADYIGEHSTDKLTDGILGVARGGTGNSTGTATYATTEAETSAGLYIVGVKSNATTDLKRNTLATLTGAVLALGNASTAGKVTLHETSSNTGTLVSAALSENRIWTFPNATGTIELTSHNHDEVYTKINQAVPYIVGPDNDTAGTWTGSDSSITAYTDGLTIIYVPGVAGASTTTLEINGLGAKTCYFTNTSKLTTHFSVGTPIMFTYVNGAWRRADYDSNTNTLLRVYTQDTGYNDKYPILIGRSTAKTLTDKDNNKYTDIYGVIYKTNAPTLNPSTGLMDVHTLTVSGTTDATSSAGTLIVSGGVLIKKKLYVTTAATMASTLTVSGAASLSSTLTVTGNTTLKGKIIGSASNYGATLPSSPTTGQIFFQTSDPFNDYVLNTGDTMTGELKFTCANAIRFAYTGAAQKYKSIILRQDENNFYVLVSETANGSWATPSIGHPFYISMTDSACHANRLYGAVWNDYAEYRNADSIEAGRVVVENGNDTLTLSTSRLQPGAEIISDTYGFAIGQTNNAKTPIATSGRVLAYPYESREECKANIGKPVCSGPNGTVSIMTQEEYEKYGYCAIGTISAVPDYEEWGEGNVQINGRIWIRVK